MPPKFAKHASRWYAQLLAVVDSINKMDESDQLYYREQLEVAEKTIPLLAGIFKIHNESIAKS